MRAQSQSMNTRKITSAATLLALLLSTASWMIARSQQSPIDINGQTLPTTSKSKPGLLLARNQTPPSAASLPAPLKLEHTLKGHGADTLAFSPDGQTLATVQGKLNLWDVKTGKLKGGTALQSPVSFAEFSPTAPLLALLLGEEESQRKLVFWNSDTHQIVRTLKNTVPGEVDWKDYAFSPDGKILATAQGAYDGTHNVLKLRNVKTGAEIKRISDVSVNNLAFSPDGKLLAAGSTDAVRLWNVGSGKLVKKFDAPGLINTIVFSSDGKILASADPGKKIFEGSIRLWNVASGQLLHSVKPDWYNPGSILFARDNQTVIIGGGNLPNYNKSGKILDKESSVVTFYSVSNGKLKSALKLSGGPVKHIALSPDGKTLVTSEYGISGGNTAVKLWQLG